MINLKVPMVSSDDKSNENDYLRDDKSGNNEE